MPKKTLAAADTAAGIAPSVPPIEEKAASPNPEPSEAANAPPPDDETRQARIRDAAYAAYERRGSQPGTPLDDWLEGERALDADKAGDASPEETP